MSSLYTQHPTDDEHHGRTFLVVVDESEEMRAALRYACKRALNTGGMVALLMVVDPPEFQHFGGIGRLMSEEARAKAEEILQRLAAEVKAGSGHTPTLYIREGDRATELLDLINEERDISILVLASGTGPEGPGPLVSSLSGKLINKLRVPVTLVPGHLSDGAIDVLT
ncbi:universal stress protein [Insolitispirillum peregrinum]|uniref:universal stress protein n=1 Tax=Insolitispirillum peregrinum TaxID=80876 RepID=UPI0036128A28